MLWSGTRSRHFSHQDYEELIVLKRRLELNSCERQGDHPGDLLHFLVVEACAVYTAGSVHLRTRSQSE
jgi:hypothetical protein